MKSKVCFVMVDPNGREALAKLWRQILLEKLRGDWQPSGETR